MSLEERITQLEGELDLARTVVGAVLDARNSIDKSIARGLAKEFLLKDNKLAFYKERAKELPRMMAIAASKAERRMV